MPQKGTMVSFIRQISKNFQYKILSESLVQIAIHFSCVMGNKTQFPNDLLCAIQYVKNIVIVCILIIITFTYQYFNHLQ